jgi:hypothetical protein
VVVRLGLLEVVERRLDLSPVVQEIAQVDPRLEVMRVELEGAAEVPDGVLVRTQPMIGVAKAGTGFRRIGMGGTRDLEEPARGLDGAFPEQGRLAWSTRSWSS